MKRGTGAIFGFDAQTGNGPERPQVLLRRLHFPSKRYAGACFASDSRAAGQETGSSAPRRKFRFSRNQMQTCTAATAGETDTTELGMLGIK